MQQFRITNLQFTILAIITAIGDSILMIPYIITEKSGPDAWLSFLIGAAVGITALYVITKTIQLNPHHTIIENGRKILGKYAIFPVGLFFIFYVFINVSAHIRELSDFVVVQVMPDTPLQAIIFLILVATLYGAYLGIEVLARASQLFFPFMIIFFTITMSLLIGNINMNYILPMMENGFMPLMKGALPAATYPFMELCFLFFVAPYVEDKSKITKNIYTGAVIGAIFIFIMILMCLLVLGPYITSNHLYPSYTLAKKISLGNFFQRIEATLALLWTVTIFLKISSGFLIMGLGIKQLFKLESEKRFLLPFGLIMFYISMTLAPNVIYFNQVIANHWWLLDTLAGFVLPTILLIIYGLRKLIQPSFSNKQGDG